MPSRPSRKLLSTLLAIAFLFLGPFVAPARCQTVPGQIVPTPDFLAQPLDRWTVGGKLTVTKTPDGFHLAVPPDADWGHIWVDVDTHLDDTPYIGIWVNRIGRDTKWLLTANDPEVKTLEPGAEDVGLAVYDLRAKTGWQGKKQFRLYLTVQGKGGSADVAWVGLFRDRPIPPYRSVRWTRMNGSDTPYSAATGGIDLTMPSAAPDADQWGGLMGHLSLDVDYAPLVEATVTGLAPGARWRLALAGVASGPEQRNNGTVAFNYRDFTEWRGRSDVDVQVVFARMGGGAAGTVSGVQFVPYPTASAGIVRAARETSPKNVQPLMDVGGFRLSYDQTARVFRLERPGKSVALVSRFLELPGFDLAPPRKLAVQNVSAGKNRIVYTCERNGATFTVMAEATNTFPGLLHTRVTMRPNQEIRLPSSGHEWAYAPEDSESAPPLRRWASQNLAASGLCYVGVPGLGRVFYLQNLTALNPLFDLCGMSPRWLVSAGNSTFGCANPLDTGHTFMAGKTVVLSDSFLTFSTDSDESPAAVAEGFLSGLATTCGALPDRPKTRWLDWQGLAQQSLKDILNGDCWREYRGVSYLQSYVGPPGSSPMLAATQDLYAPLLAYRPTDPQVATARETVLSRLRTAVPTFWSTERGTFREAASPGDHVWYNIPFHITLARAALAGEEPARTLCLKSADALMRLAADTKDTFQRDDLKNSAQELAGTYILFMMQCYTLDPTQKQYLEEAKRVAKSLSEWTLDGTRETYWTAMTCEGLARLYAATKDRTYIKTSLIPLARLLRNAWFWQCDYGQARGWMTFGGLNADASGIDYIAAMEQYQTWLSLREYCRLTEGALPPDATFLADELIRYIPQTIWDAYPAHLPPDSLHQGLAFWKSQNNYALAIPVEDLNDGWRKNGSVGQELYGAGASFALASRAYTTVRGTDCTVFSEHLLRGANWNAAEGVLTLRLGGSSRRFGKIEINGMTGLLKASIAPQSKPDNKAPQRVAVLPDGRVRLEAPGDSLVRLRFAPSTSPVVATAPAPTAAPASVPTPAPAPTKAPATVANPVPVKAPARVVPPSPALAKAPNRAPAPARKRPQHNSVTAPGHPAATHEHNPW